MMKMEMLYAVFVRFNGNTDNARSGNIGFDLTLRKEIMVFNTKYILYSLMTKSTKKMKALPMTEIEKRANARALKQANKVAKEMGF